MDILSIDDLGDTVALVRGNLKRVPGVNLVEAKDWVEAEAALNARHFDYIICDSRFPGKDGVSDLLAGPKLISELRQGMLGHANQNTAAVLLTAFAPQVTAAASQVSGMPVLPKRAGTLVSLSNLLGIDLVGDPQPVETTHERIDEIALVEKPYSEGDSEIVFTLFALPDVKHVRYPVSELPLILEHPYITAPRPWAVWITYDVPLGGGPVEVVDMRHDFG